MSKSLVLCVFLLLAGVVSGCGGSSSTTPAATVNGHDISMANYDKAFTMKRRLATQNNPDVCAQKGMESLCGELKRTTLDGLIKEELVREYAAKRHLTVSTADFNAQWQAIFRTKYHSNRAVVNAYAHGLGIGVKDLQQQVRDNLLQQAVIYDVTRRMPTNGNAVKVSRIAVATPQEVQAIQKQLRRGIPFSRIALTLSKSQSSLCSRVGCGLLGWLPYSFVPSSQHAIITAADGTVVGPFSAQQTLTLVRVERHFGHYPYTPEQQFAMRQQLFTRWITAQQQKASVQRHIAT